MLAVFTAFCSIIIKYDFNFAIVFNRCYTGHQLDDKVILIVFFIVSKAALSFTVMYVCTYVCMYVCMRFGTAKIQLRAAGGYFSLPPWLNNPFSKWWLGIHPFRNAQNSDRYFSLFIMCVGRP